MSKNKQDYNKTGQNEAISNVFSLHTLFYNYYKYISVHNNIYVYVYLLCEVFSEVA